MCSEDTETEPDYFSTDDTDEETDEETDEWTDEETSEETDGVTDEDTESGNDQLMYASASLRLPAGQTRHV